MTATATHRSRRFWLGAASSSEEALDRARQASGWVLREVDATDEQRRRIDAIVAASVGQVYPLVERHRQHHRELLEALARPEVDRAEVERLRKAELELADAASSRLADAAVEVLGVLTPAQREQLLAHLRERHT